MNKEENRHSREVVAHKRKRANTIDRQILYLFMHNRIIHTTNAHTPTPDRMLLVFGANFYLWRKTPLVQLRASSSSTSSPQTDMKVEEGECGSIEDEDATERVRNRANTDMATRAAAASVLTHYIKPPEVIWWSEVWINAHIRIRIPQMLHTQTNTDPSHTPTHPAHAQHTHSTCTYSAHIPTHPHARTPTAPTYIHTKLGTPPH